MSQRHAEKGTIAIDFVDEALVCIRDAGLDAAAILTAACISPELLASPQARVSSSQYGQLWHLIAETLDDEFFGMDRHRMKQGSFTLLCHAVIQADTLERALRRALRFLRLVLDGIEGELRVEDGVARIVLQDRGPPQRAFAYGTFLLMLHGLACWLVGRRIPLHAADFRCAEPRYSGEWRVLFAQQLNFDRETSGIAFDADYLALPNIQNERTMKAFLRSAPANFLVKYKNSASLSARIRRRLRELPPAAWPEFDALAQQFHASAATLRRRLDDEGESFRSIMDGMRRDLAISMLCDTRHPIVEIAAELGFAEASAFHRAFKKWTGTRPGEYRLRTAR
ncbi:MAG: AraC family transcriptional regulator [Burkholderiales bacterium]|nr:AraC family transcriptional regulator [Burkholderiales bacterium]